MKCTIPEISWHNRDPVLCLDVQPLKNGMVDSPYRLATGGTDSHVVIWYVTVKECGLASVEVAADLQRHQRAVNTVRFSPSGQFLASGDDESVIIVWKPKTEHDISDLTNTDGEVNKEQWVSMKTLRGHLEDVYDLSWSLDSVHLISGSIDNTAIIWDVQKGRNLGILSGHGGFVQGVTWDPKNKYAATLSSDRTCRIHNISTKKLTAKISKTTLPVPPESELSGKIMRLFHDDTLKTFFRRLSFSPDGELLVTPSGVIEIPNTEKHINATYIFSRFDFSRPVAYLPSHEYTVTVRFCPLLFKLREGNSLFALPYRMVFAVATKSNVILYDTQQPEPFALISKIHYTRLTDLSWSSDGRVLVACSTDGYCSIITFSQEELGEAYELSSVNTEGENETQDSESKQPESSETLAQNQQDLCVLNISSDSEKGSEKEKDIVVEGKKINSKVLLSHIPIKQIVAENEASKHAVQVCTTPVSEKKSPRRIPLITLSSPRKRFANTSETGSKKNSSEAVPSKGTSTVPTDLDQCKTVKHLGPSKNAIAEDCSKEVSSSDSAKEKTVTNALVEPMRSEKMPVADSSKKQNDENVVNEVLSEENSVELMEVDSTIISTEKKDGLPENVMSNVDTASSCVEVSSTSTSSEEQSQQKKIGQLLKANTNLSNASNNDDDIKTEDETKKNLPNEDQNGHELEVHTKSNKDEKDAPCEISPIKDSAPSTYETTPSKLDDVQTKVVTSAVTPVDKRTPRRVQFITISSPKSKKKLL